MSDAIQDMKDAHIAELEQRAQRRKLAPEILTARGIPFISHNDGAHLVCKAANGHHVDYWPGPNKWHVRPFGSRVVTAPARRGATLLQLIRFCKE